MQSISYMLDTCYVLFRQPGDSPQCFCVWFAPFHNEVTEASKWVELGFTLRSALLYKEVKWWEGLSTHSWGSIPSLWAWGRSLTLRPISLSLQCSHLCRDGWHPGTQAAVGWVRDTWPEGIFPAGEEGRWRLGQHALPSFQHFSNLLPAAEGMIPLCREEKEGGLTPRPEPRGLASLRGTSLAHLDLQFP